MPRIQNIIDEYILPVVLLIIPFTFPYPKLSLFNIPMVALASIWLLKPNLIQRIKSALTNRDVLLFIIIYLLLILFLPLSENQTEGRWILEKKLPLLAFPIILSTVTIHKKIINLIPLSFVATCFFASAACILNIVYHDKFVADSVLTIDSFERERFCSFLKIHPPYLSLYITFSIIIICYYLTVYWYTIANTYKIFTIVALAYFVGVNILLSSRMPLFVLMIFLVAGMFYFIRKHPITGLSILLATISIFTILITNYDVLKDRLTEMYQTEWTPPRGIYYNSTNLRVGIWNCSFSLLKDNWVFGLGTGAVQQNLDNCYKENGYSDILYTQIYNTHNEYLNVWLNLGIVGLIFFTMSLFVPFFKALKGRDYLYLAFLMLIIMSCMTENLLERQKGVILYSFFNAFFSFHFVNYKNQA